MKNIFYLIAGNILIFLIFWLMQINLSWLAYQLTNSSFLLGLLGFFINLPMVIAIPIGGVWSDIWSRKHIMAISQFFYLVPNLLLFFMTLTHHITYWSMVAVGLIYGILFAFTKPASDALVYDVSRTDQQLKCTVSLNSSASQISLLFAPILSQFILHWFKLPSIFVLSSLLNIIILLSFFRLNTTQNSISTPNEKGTFNRLLREGLSYMLQEKTLILYIILISLSLGVIISIQFQFPAIISVLHNGLKTDLYLFYFYSALGGLSGAVFIIFYKYSKKASLNLLLLFLACQALGILILPITKNIAWCYLLIFLISSFGMAASIIGTLFIQKATVDEKRGRVMSLLAMARIGSIPIVSLIVGLINLGFGIFYGLIILGSIYFTGIIIFKFYLLIKQRNSQSNWA